MLFLQFILCVILFELISAENDKTRAMGPISTGTILVNFMADYSQNNLIKFVSQSNCGIYYNGRFYWLGNRFYNKTKNTIPCSFPTPSRFPFIYKDSKRKVTEIMFQCAIDETCCEAGCCKDKAGPMSKVKSESQAPAKVAGQASTKSGDPPDKASADKSSNNKASSDSSSPISLSGFSSSSVVGTTIGVLLLIAVIISCVCCCMCRRRRAKSKTHVRRAPQRRGPTLRPGYGTMAKLAMRGK